MDNQKNHGEHLFQLWIIAIFYVRQLTIWTPRYCFIYKNPVAGKMRLIQLSERVCFWWTAKREN